MIDPPRSTSDHGLECLNRRAKPTRLAVVRDSVQAVRDVACAVKSTFVSAVATATEP